jgi:hypothetical protein
VFNEIIFVDFENFANITDDIKKTDAKIIVLVGMNQAKKSFAFASELLDSVSSVELLKVKGTGKNALDFFIAYYLGIYTSRYKNLKFTICSNDLGYDPLIKHLSENGITIKRLETHKEQIVVEEKPKAKTTQKPKKQPNLFEIDEDYKKAFNNIKNIPTKSRPKKLKGLEAHIHNLFSKTMPAEKIKKIMNEFKKCKYIEIEDEKIKYNL